MNPDAGNKTQNIIIILINCIVNHKILYNLSVLSANLVKFSKQISKRKRFLVIRFLNFFVSLEPITLLILDKIDYKNKTKNGGNLYKLIKFKK